MPTNLPLHTLPTCDYIASMEAGASYKSWWRPLPKWLKGVTVLVAYPAWILIVYCILTGHAKSTAALFAFVAFAITALLHVIVDSRNRRGDPEVHGGLDLTGGGE